MKPRILATAAAFLALSGPLAAQDLPKVDPALRMLDRPAVREAIRRAARLGPDAPLKERPLAGAIALDRGPLGETRVGAFVRLRRPIEGALAELRASGAVVGTVAGDIATARIPLDALARLSRSDRLVALTAARPVPIEHDSSMRAIRADEVRSFDGARWAGRAGHGVLVGIYDTGVEYQHDDFLDDAGRPRVVGIWDQTAGAGAPPDGYTYGAYCDRASLESRSCDQRDIVGHGTHVAGSAVGDGSSSAGRRYAGVAPGADLIVVKGGDVSFSNADIVDGVAWMFEMAERRDQPIVVNLSLGSQFGAHDGTSAFAAALSNLAGPGKLVVAAAGNAGSNGNATNPEGGSPRRRYIHAMATPAVGETDTFTFEIPGYGPNSGGCNDAVWAELWYDGEDRVDVTVVRPDGSSASAAWGEETSDPDPNGEIYIDNASQGADAGNGDHLVTIQLTDCGSAGAPAAGTWEVRTTATAAPSGDPLHMWIAYSGLGNEVAYGEDGFDNRYIISAPGAGANLIAVGAFATRMCWPTDGGQTYCYIEQEEVGDLARFSPAGPTRDGRIRPEIVAPGIGVMSVRASTADVPAPRIGPGGDHMLREGTSMSAPHVVGTIALLLQADASLTAQDVRENFSRTGGQDIYTVRTYPASTLNPSAAASDWWGYGKLDAKATVDDVSVTPSTLVLEATPLSPPDVMSRQGTALSLISMELRTDGGESVMVRRVGFRVEGADPEARMLLVVDADRDGAVGPDERVLADVDVALELDRPTELDVQSPSFVVPGRDTLHVLAAVRLSGKVPNGATFRAEFLPSRTQTVGVASGEEDRFEQPGDVVASQAAQTTLLAAGEIFALSENPVRSERLVFNFAEEPTVAAVYSIDGRRIRDLLPLLASTGVRVEWDLRNASGGRVAPGVYLAVFRIGNELIREKLFIVNGASPDDTEE